MGLRIVGKLALIGVLLLLLLIPLGLLDGLVSERKVRAAEVVAEIAQASAREQRLLGPLLVLHYRETRRQRREVVENGIRREVEEVLELPHVRVVAPEVLAVRNRLDTEIKRRGLFTARLYQNHAGLQGSFRIPADPAADENRLTWQLTSARLVLGFGDARGIQSLKLRGNGRELTLEPGTLLPWLGEGVHAPLPAALTQADARLEFDGELQLTGSSSLSWVPVAGEAQISSEADWPHPSFFGNRLPVNSRIDENGFRAEWKVSRLSSQALQALASCGYESDGCGALESTGFGVRLIDPVDRYLMTERAMKYALLLLVLVFGAVFFIEALRQIEVHLLQYGLVGLALAIFFLLLLSLSEHLGFALAYMLAAAACVALITAYLSGALGGFRRGLLLGGLLAGLYGLLYGLLQSEDYALLMGSLALFGLLATVMLLTRRLDWSGLGRKPPAPTLAQVMAAPPATAPPEG